MQYKTLANFFQRKRVLITGHTGFKGSWLAQILLRWRAKICGYALQPDTKPNLFNILNLENSLEHHIADIRDFRKFNRIVKNFKPEIIFHLAAQPLVRISYDNPVYTYETNVMGTVNVLEAIRLNNIKAGLIITTDKVYKNLEKNIAFKEEDALGGYDPYSNSKACADLIVNSYIQSFFNPRDFRKRHQTLIASARSGNVIGGGDWGKDRLIPDLIRAFFQDKKTLAIRNPEAIRPWQYILDPLVGYLLLAKNLYQGYKNKSGAWNFGPSPKSMLKVKDVIQIVMKQIRKGKVSICKDPQKHETTILKLDNSKARQKLKWKSKLNIRQAINQTLTWYQMFYFQKVNMGDYTNKQMDQYFAK